MSIALERSSTSTKPNGNAAIAAYYQSLAKHWRSLALLNENKTEREHTGQDAGR
jgi:hypothetical protein